MLRKVILNIHTYGGLLCFSYLMILGIVALCQPWNMLLHQYGLTITLIGLVGFMITTKVPREEKDENPET